MTGAMTAPPRHGPSPTASGRGDQGRGWRGAGTATTGGSAGSGPGLPSPARPAATVALAALTVVSAAGLFRLFSTSAWVGPVIGTILVVHLVCWALRRVRVGQLASVPAVVLTIVLMASWTVFGRYTAHGLPSRGVWHQAVTALGDLGNEISAMIPRVAPTHAFELVAVLGAGVAAALADWAAFRWRVPMLALVPAVAVFTFCGAAGIGRGRGLVIGAEVVGLCLFLVVERATADGRLWFAGLHSGVGAWAAAIGGIMAAVAVTAAMAVSPALAARDGSAVLGWRNGFGSGGGTRVVQNPLVNLQTRLLQFRNVPVFLVTSSEPSYWRLTSLNQFDGTTWQSSGEYSGFGSRLPGSPPNDASVRTVRATFQIQDLDSDWLPAQFEPFSVQGVKGVTYDPSSNSLLTSTATNQKFEYTVTSYQYLDTLSATALESAPAPSPGDPNVTKNLGLPPLDPTVTNLAQQITAGATTEYAKALAIQNFLLGPQFHYSLTPPPDGSGNQALLGFLFHTRTGYCEQFAGTYAAMARAVGLPTRLAFGFVQGDRAGAGTYQVYDRDAHTWPEVYFGPKFGWVPFEPTKGFAVPGAGAYTGQSGEGNNHPSSTPTTVPITVPGKATVPGKTPAVTHRTLPSDSPTQPAIRSTTSISPWWLAVPAVILAWPLLNRLGPVLRLRRRRRKAARAGPRSVTINARDEVANELGWLGVERRPDETDDEFWARASAFLRRLGLDGGWVQGGPTRLAVLSRQATFAASVPDDLGVAAVATAQEIQARVVAATGRRQRLARWVRPRPGTLRRMMDLLHPGPAGPPVAGGAHG